MTSRENRAIFTGGPCGFGLGEGLGAESSLSRKAFVSFFTSGFVLLDLDNSCSCHC